MKLGDAIRTLRRRVDHLVALEAKKGSIWPRVNEIKALRAALVSMTNEQTIRKAVTDELRAAQTASKPRLSAEEVVETADAAGAS